MSPTPRFTSKATLTAVANELAGRLAPAFYWANGRQHPVNHQRRLRQAGQKGGVPAMFRYLNTCELLPELEHLDPTH